VNDATRTGPVLLEWDPRAGLVRGDDDPAAAGEPLLAADSWLVDAGRVRALDRHLRRFTSACDGTPAAARIEAFLSAAVAALPRTGQWFPRLELTAGHRLRLRIRPAPPLADTVRVWVADAPDARTAPRRKGPDLTYLAGLRTRAGAAGADDALLLDEAGVVLEAAHASVLWWDGDALCVPDPRLAVLPGVTAGTVLDRASALGVPVRHRQARLDELSGHETWLLNALHGIRPVVAWVGADLPVGPAERIASWRHWLASRMAALPPG
jgi:branched-subunit amino acid aminotransferase/4-amino-4-deoxychorismate lyase